MEQQTSRTDLGGVATIILAIATLCGTIGGMAIQYVTLTRVEEVRHQTNSLKDELVASTRKGALLEGAKSEQEKQEKIDNAK